MEANKSKSYGLLIPKKGAVGKGNLGKAAAIFGSESSDEEGKAMAAVNKDIQNESAKKLINKQTKLEMEKALKEDPSVYDYDDVYDQMEEKKKESVQLMITQEKKSKYIEKLLKSAESRKQGEERRKERKIEKEREEEGDEFKDKEAFVTSAYRQKMEERAEEEEKLRKQDELDAANDVSKQKDLGHFYRNLLTKNVDMGGQDEEILPEKEKAAKTESEEWKLDKKDDNSSRGRSYRRRNPSFSDDTDPNEDIHESFKEKQQKLDKKRRDHLAFKKKKTSAYSDEEIEEIEPRKKKHNKYARRTNESDSETDRDDRRRGKDKYQRRSTSVTKGRDNSKLCSTDKRYSDDSDFSDNKKITGKRKDASYVEDEDDFDRNKIKGKGDSSDLLNANDNDSDSGKKMSIKSKKSLERDNYKVKDREGKNKSNDSLEKSEDLHQIESVRRSRSRHDSSGDEFDFQEKHKQPVVKAKVRNSIQSDDESDDNIQQKKLLKDIVLDKESNLSDLGEKHNPKKKAKVKRRQEDPSSSDENDSEEKSSTKRLQTSKKSSHKTSKSRDMDNEKHFLHRDKKSKRRHYSEDSYSSSSEEDASQAKKKSKTETHSCSSLSKDREAKQTKDSWNKIYAKRNTVDTIEAALERYLIRKSKREAEARQQNIQDSD